MSISQSTQEISAFDVATDTSFLGKSNSNTFIFTGFASKKWCIGDVPNGGYVLAIIIDSVIRHFDESFQIDPVALNCFFFKKTIPGHLIVEIEELKMSKKGYCVVRAILKQRVDLQPLTSLENYDPSQWQDKVQGIFTMGNMDNEKGPTHFYKNPLQPSTEHLEPYNYVFMGEFLNTTIDKSKFPKSDIEAGSPEVIHTMEFKDSRPIDFKSIPYWCDMFNPPPTLLGPAILNGPVWCPTMQLEIQFKRKPSGKRITGRYISPHIINGRFDMSGEIWNEQGEILAITRHQCLIVPWSRNSKDESKVNARKQAMMEKSKI
ncbi:thioesterase-like superfamily-domain-containing protein [Parasitella parasitica]|nr:thioesterase-like superfamily-domain-containing protein [Parasitella parasitica]